jgi:hypothetical protein
VSLYVLVLLSIYLSADASICLYVSLSLSFYLYICNLLTFFNGTSTLSTMTFTINDPSITIKNGTPSIKHMDILCWLFYSNAECSHAECCYADCCYVDCLNIISSQ